MMKSIRNLLFAAALAAPVALPARAHVSLEQASAAAGSSYKAVLRVGHGCNGAPTTGLTVRLPPGFRGAKPMPKPGWTVAIKQDALATPYESHGRRVTSDVTEISWTAAGRDAWLADAHYDEFVIRGQLPSAAGPLWFKVLQSCDGAALDWSEVPATGVSTQGLKTPAVLLEVKAGPREHAAH